MHTLLTRSQFWIANFSLLLLLGASFAPAEAVSKSLAPSPLTGISAEGGYEYAWVSWDTPSPKLRRTIDSYTILSLPDKASHKCPTSTVDRCKVKIANPWDGKGSEPDAWGYSFKVFVDGDIGTGWSATSNTVYMTFPKKKVIEPTKTPVAKVSSSTPSRSPTPTPTPSRSPTPTPTPSRSPSSSPTPSQTLTPTPKAPSISDFDGSYSGFLSVSLTPAILPVQNIPFTLQLINGKGQGQGGGWRESGAVSDAQGNATVTITNAIYGSFTVPVTFSLNISNQKKTGTGSGIFIVPVRGVGEITFDFTFNVATK